MNGIEKKYIKKRGHVNDVIKHIYFKIFMKQFYLFVIGIIVCINAFNLVTDNFLFRKGNTVYIINGNKHRLNRQAGGQMDTGPRHI